jgi:hypothetical protein
MDTHSPSVPSKGTSTTTITKQQPAATTSSVQQSAITGQVTSNKISGPRRPTLNGTELEELSVLFAGTPPPAMFFVTASSNESLNRVYYHDEKYIVGAGGSRSGYSSLYAADIRNGEAGRGLYLYWSTGHNTFVPEHYLQYTWKYVTQAVK